jgi:putative ABC transport system permease protein
MSRLKGLAARVRSVFGARASEQRMEEEFAFHVEMEAKRLVATERLGIDEARRRALVSFGGLDTHRESMRDERGTRWFADFGADVRYALRTMCRAPGFAIAVALTLGIGVGVNGLVFSYVDALLFRPIPAREPERLVALFNLDPTMRRPTEVAYEDYLDFRDKSDVFDGLAGMTGVPLNLVVPGSSSAADMVWGEMVTENFFTVLGMRPALGRLFSTNDAPAGSNPLAVLSHESWMRRFGGDSSVIGRAVRINGSGFTVVGVAPRGFNGMRTFGYWPEIWVPLGMHDVVMPGSRTLLEGRGGGWMMVVGRMRRGMTRETTEAAAARFAGQLATTYPATNANVGAIVIPAEMTFDHPAYVKPKNLFLASGLGLFASLVTLAIICANLANLQLARAASRVHEVAIRLSLGCSRARLTRQMLVESAILALPGVLLAAVILPLTPALESVMLPRLQFRVGMDVSVSPRVVTFTACVTLLAVALFGLVPALRASGRTSFSGLLGARRSSTSGPRRLRGILVVSQLSLSVVLLVGAGLFARSMLVAATGDLGFEPRNRALVSVNVGLQGYDAARGARFYDDVLARVRAMPSVESATWAFPVPFDTYGRGMDLFVDGVATTSNDGVVSVDASFVAEDFVNALGLRMRAGRGFTTSDSVGAPLVMVVSRQLAERLWPGRDPIGRRARRGSANGPEIVVAGVVDDAKFQSLAPTTTARVYIPLRQSYRDWQTLIVKTRDAAETMLPSIRAAVTALDPALPTFGATTLDRNVASGMSLSRSAAAAAGFFGVLALLVSSVGLYAVVASGVTERTREIGVRVALGSSPGDVMRFVMRSGAVLGLAGLVLGLAGASVVARLMGALLYGLSPADPITFSLVPLTLALVVLVATYIPARRAVRLDPMSALRSD